MIDKTKIIAEFNRIKSLGFIKSNRSHNTGIGKTFEDYLGVKDNNTKEPDFVGFEVKSQRVETESFLTLFTKSPSGPKGANKYLRDSFGEEYAEYEGLKRIHTSIFSDKFNTYRDLYRFKILNDEINQKIKMSVKSISNDEIIDENIYWSYQDLEKCIDKKMKALFYVNAESKVIDDGEYFHYTAATIYLKPSLEKLLKLLNDGKLMVDIRIGSYKMGSKKGKPHDHGTAFRIKPNDLGLLYDEVITV